MSEPAYIQAYVDFLSFGWEYGGKTGYLIFECENNTHFTFRQDNIPLIQVIQTLQLFQDIKALEKGNPVLIKHTKDNEITHISAYKSSPFFTPLQKEKVQSDDEVKARKLINASRAKINQSPVPSSWSLDDLLIEAQRIGGKNWREKC